MDFFLENFSESNKFEIADLYTDGASRGNPGQAGIGFCMICNGKVYLSEGFSVGIITNNHAEYLAFIVALFSIRKNFPSLKVINLYADSLLLIRQIKGEYTVRNERLIYCNKLLKKLLFNITLHASYIPRELNKSADYLANRGIDENRELSGEIFNCLLQYNCI